MNTSRPLSSLPLANVMGLDSTIVQQQEIQVQVQECCQVSLGQQLAIGLCKE